MPDKSRVQVNVSLAETLGLNRFNPDYYALELGNHVLGGGFYATRLYQDLRENSGLVYFVSSSFGVGKTRSVYRVDYACDPQNVSKARAVVERDLKAMQTDARERGRIAAGEGHAAAADSARRGKRRQHCGRVDIARNDWFAAR